MSILYHFGGLLISSDIPLRSIVPAQEAAGLPADIKIDVRHDKTPEPDRHIFAWPGRYGLRLGEFGDKWLMQSKFGDSFLINRDGSALTIITEVDLDSETLVDVLIRRVLPRVAILHGKMAIHSAAFASANEAVLVVGPSGAGKSTLSAAISCQPGWTVFSDDISIVDGTSEPQLHSSVTDICVWPETSEGLGLDKRRFTEMADYEGKLRFYPGNEAPMQSAPLRHIISLSPISEGASPSLAPLALADCLSAIDSQVIKFNPPRDVTQAQNAARLAKLLPIISNFQGWQLSYPKSYDVLPRMIELIQNLSAKT
jgi:hypothetical protein